MIAGRMACRVPRIWRLPGMGKVRASRRLPVTPLRSSVRGERVSDQLIEVTFSVRRLAIATHRN